ncbi:MAG: UDP-N-acetylmuramate:L-alanyl-gamma-D-glutamyl-meso-diaminopimelate ligase [Betaproteobacteria bacterium]|nr:UDP-N-acetylmuramate:L-alanyl-gamma-D-glutamyl-meso-diaminopimelate ligase [Betaproteobacteria bacterium]
MHLHILGICGTFMGGLALIARAAGHRVTGCDANVYPPMSDQLAASGIELINGWNVDQIALQPDVFVIGNVVTRGNPLMEEILERGFPYISGPQWLSENVLAGKWVIAVAGTHGKTTVSAMLAWILEESGLAPGFLIGGIANNFGVSARLPGPRSSAGKLKSISGLAKRDHHGETLRGSPFVVEADEYDTAFFDKRSKFLHYPARTTVLNNLEFDHADIFPDLAAIETQFHHFVRTLPASGLIVANGTDAAVARVLERGCYTPVERFGVADGWSAGGQNAGGFEVRLGGEPQGRVVWTLTGAHNRANALAAIAAARHCGVAPAQAIAALGAFEGVRRRMEVRGIVNGIAVYDDFAHHPTAIAATLEGLRSKVNGERILAVLEPRSNTMKLGMMKDRLAASLVCADRVYCYSAGLKWDAATALAPLGARAVVTDDFEKLVGTVASESRPGDHVVIMSNGGFGGIHEKLLALLAQGKPGEREGGRA